MGGGSSKSKVSNTINSTMLSESLLTSQSTCMSSQTGTQSITVNQGVLPNGDPYPSLATISSYCVDRLSEIMKSRRDNQRAKGVTVDTLQGPLATAMTTGGTPAGIDMLGPCTLVSTAIYVTNINQKLATNSTAQCQVTTDSISSFNNSLTGKTSSENTSKQDALGSFMKGLVGEGNDLKVSNTMNYAIKESSTTKVVNELKQKLNLAQSVGITDSYSVFVDNVNQQLEAQATAIMTVTTETLNESKKSVDYSVTQSLLDKNDTIGDLANSVTGAFTTINGVVGQLAFSLVLIIGLIVIDFVCGSIIYFNLHKELNGGMNLVQLVNAAAKAAKNAKQSSGGSFRSVATAAEV